MKEYDIPLKLLKPIETTYKNIGGTWRRVQYVLVHDLYFADDLALSTENVNRAQILLSKLEEEA